ncbi:hypothetical protein [Xaviernesmea rhizosphaerae]
MIRFIPMPTQLARAYQDGAADAYDCVRKGGKPRKAACPAAIA